MKCWKSTFNAQGSRLTIEVLQVGLVKIYVATMEVLKKGKTGWNSVHTKIEIPPPMNANVFYFFEYHPIYDQTQGSSLFSLLYR